MGYKKLISPEFRVTVGDYEVTDGIEVECFSSKESHMDWCRVELSPQLQGVLKFKDMDEASVELGYEDDFDSLIDGYVRCGDTDYWKEIMIKDDMMKLDRVTIKASFVDCEPQDVIRYVLACAGIEDYVLSDEHYGKKDLFVIDRKSGINTIAEVNSSWGIKNPFFFQKKVFYWGTKEEQKEIYVLEEGETILSLNKYGDLWEAETIAIPCYIAVLPVIVITTRKQDKFLSGVIFSFFYGFCGIFLADGNLINLYPMTTGLVFSNYAHDEKVVYYPALSTSVMVIIFIGTIILLKVFNRQHNDI